MTTINAIYNADIWGFSRIPTQADLAEGAIVSTSYTLSPGTSTISQFCNFSQSFAGILPNPVITPQSFSYVSKQKAYDMYLANGYVFSPGLGLNNPSVAGIIASGNLTFPDSVDFFDGFPVSDPLTPGTSQLISSGGVSGNYFQYRLEVASDRPVFILKTSPNYVTGTNRSSSLSYYPTSGLYPFENGIRLEVTWAEHAINLDGQRFRYGWDAIEWRINGIERGGTASSQAVSNFSETVLDLIPGALRTKTRVINNHACSVDLTRNDTSVEYRFATGEGRKTSWFKCKPFPVARIQTSPDSELALSPIVTTSSGLSGELGEEILFDLTPSFAYGEQVDFAQTTITSTAQGFSSHRVPTPTQPGLFKITLPATASSILLNCLLYTQAGCSLSFRTTIDLLAAPEFASTIDMTDARWTAPHTGNDSQLYRTYKGALARETMALIANCKVSSVFFDAACVMYVFGLKTGAGWRLWRSYQFGALGSFTEIGMDAFSSTTHSNGACTNLYDGRKMAIAVEKSTKRLQCKTSGDNGATWDVAPDIATLTTVEQFKIEQKKNHWIEVFNKNFSKAFESQNYGGTWTPIS